MRKTIVAIILTLLTITVLSAERYYARAFQPTNVRILNDPTVDIDSQFTKELDVTNWSNLWTKTGKPSFQTYTTKDYTIVYFFTATKNKDGEALLVRVSRLETKDDNAELIKGVTEIMNNYTKVSK